MLSCSNQSPSLILEALRILTTPERQSHTDSASSADNGENQFDHLLQTKLLSLNRNLQSDKFSSLPCLSALQTQTSPSDTDRSDVRWKYTSACLHLLFLLQKHLIQATRDFQEEMKKNPPSMKTPHQVPPLSPDVLSIEQEKTVLTTLQFIVCLGICPHVDKGVGIPIERRSGFGKLLSGSKLMEVSRKERYSRLGLCGRIFAACLNVPSLSALVLSRHLCDFLAILLQLNHFTGIFDGQKRNLNPSLRSENQTVNVESNQNDNTSNCPPKRTVSELLDSTDSNTRTNPQIVNPQDSHICHEDSSSVSESRMGVNESKCSISNAKSNAVADSCQKTVSQADEYLSLLLGELSVVDSDQEFAEAGLQKLMTRVSPAMLVRDLMLLQGAAKPRAGAKSKGQGKPLPVSPPWLRQVCGRLMTDILMRPKGLLHVLQGMLPPGPAPSGDSVDWQRSQAIAMVIAHCPMHTTSVEEYYSHISPQLLGLLHHNDPKVTQRFLRVIVTLMKEMTSQHPSLGQKHLLDPLLTALQQCVDSQGTSVTPWKQVVVCDKSMTRCIGGIHKLYVISTEARGCLWPALRRYVAVLFQLYCSSKEGVSHVRSSCEDILITFLKQAEPDVSLDFLWLLATGVHGNSVKDVSQCPAQLVFRPGDSGGLCAVIASSDSCEEDSICVETRVRCLVELVKHLQDNSVTGDFFIKLLQELTMMVSSQTDDEDTISVFSPEPGKELLMLELQDTQEVELFNRRLIVLNLLASMCEELGPSCLRKTQHILAFVRATLERGVEVCRATTEELTGLFESETLSMAMGLLTAVMGGAVQVDEADRQTMQELLPLLDGIRQEHASDEVREMADDIRIAIATRGAVWSELMKSKGDLKKPTSQAKDTDAAKKKVTVSKPKKPLIEVLSETSNETLHEVNNCQERNISPQMTRHNDEVDHKPSLETQTGHMSSGVPQEGPAPPYSASSEHQPMSSPPEEDSPHVCGRGGSPEAGAEGGSPHPSGELEQAFKELCDPEIPVRGHGLLRLTHLIQNKDSSALSRLETLVKIFEENLQHQDSYLYLASVNGLAALTDRYPDVVVPRLAKEFAETGPQKSAELRMKLGESLVKAARNLGDMIPKYRELLLAAVLSGARSDDAMVRASSLSNLAEMCKLLRFSLGNVLHEVFECCSSIVKTDLDPEVRKASILTITQLLQGLGADAPKFLGSVLRDLYRLLKLVQASDGDAMVRTHTLLALNELDVIMRAALFPQQKLEKKITILHPE
ncbi:transport and Golgi organization protein 6 homolog [Haliotis rufescens]|uniref:transport and Golgi organization protein 6 homolog n=1 Tax=Haliotis rufescens TaxID=6454 RepID=UPI00201E8935|nr:transport and Golgi organization protein 6 homolog [Haliotis rufescens]